jgi:RNA polymerase sigma-70 factor, ECF subfamily
MFPDEKFSNLLSENGAVFLRIVFDKYYGELCRLSFKYVGRTEIAEDIVQEIFINIWNKRFQLDNTGNIKPYLIRCAINASINYIKSKYNRLHLEMDVSLLEERSDYSPLDELKGSELLNLIKQAIETLPDKCRIIFVLSRFSNLTYREIAEKLGVSVKTVEAQVSIALRRLEKHVNKGGYRLPSIFL